MPPAVREAGEHLDAVSEVAAELDRFQHHVVVIA
jgi:hypothetical protein